MATTNKASAGDAAVNKDELADEAATPKKTPVKAEADRQADEAKDRTDGLEAARQDPYPLDPTNELLDGDDTPSRKDLDEAGVKVASGGTALVHDEHPGVIPAPQSANLELRKRQEKMGAALRESVGDVDEPDEHPQVTALRAERERAGGDKDRQAAIDEQIAHYSSSRSDAAQKRAAAADGDDDKARSTPPQSRSAKPTEKS